MTRFLDRLTTIWTSTRSRRKSSRRRSRPAFRPHLEALEDRRLLATLTFNGQFGNSWEEPRNWSGAEPPRVPGRVDTAIINGFDVVIGSSAAAAAFEVSNGSLTINASLIGEFNSPPGPLSLIAPTGTVTLNSGIRFSVQRVEIDGAFLWNGGIVDSTRFINRGLMTLASNEDMAPGPIENFATIVHTGTGRLTGSTINHPDGLYDLQSDADLTQNIFRNLGTLRKSGGTGTSEFTNGSLKNEGGQVEVQSGTLVLHGSTATGGHTGGHFVVDQGAVLELASGIFTGTHTGSGAGLIRLAAGTNASGLNIGIGDATFDFPPGLLHWTQGDINIGTTGPWRNVGSLTLSGPDRRNLAASFNPLENSGTIVHTDTGELAYNGVLTNRGVYRLESDAGLTTGAGGIVNTGVFEKTGGSGTSQVFGVFANEAGGQLNIRTGIIQMDNRPTSSEGINVNQGTVAIDAGSALELVRFSTPYTYTASSVLDLELDGTNPLDPRWGQVRVAGDSSFDTLISLAGTLSLRQVAPVPGTFVIIDNDGTNAVNGTFDNLPEGSILMVDGTGYQISYVGGDGNDVTLTNRGAGNAPPTASAGGPYNIQEGNALTLDASASSDPDGDLLTYSWDVNGDGVFGDAADVMPTLSWAELQALGIDDGPATRNVRVQVSDSVNPAVTSDAAALSVSDTAPTIALAGAAGVNEGSLFTLTLGAVTDPGNDTVTQYVVHWGDGSTDTYLSPGDVIHTYADGPAVRTIVVDLVNEDGSHPGAGSRTVMVANVAPTATVAGPSDGEVGELLTFKFTASDPSPADEAAGFSYRIDWGDGTPPETVTPTPGNGSGVSLMHAYAEAGSFTVQVTATDVNGATGAAALLDLTITAEALTPIEQFVARAYLAILQREVDVEGLAFWSSSLEQNQLTRTDLALALTQTQEYRTLVINEAYQSLLGRPADPSGLSFFTQLLSLGLPVEVVRGALLSSDEYFIRVGGSNDAFLSGLYQAALGREIDPDGLAFWSQQLSQGTPRFLVVGAVLTSREARAFQVQGLYQRFLGRAADPGGLDFFTNLLLQGVLQEEEIIALLVGSDEFFNQQ